MLRPPRDPLVMLGFIFTPSYPKEMLGGERRCRQLLIIYLSRRKSIHQMAKLSPRWSWYQHLVPPAGMGTEGHHKPPG